MPARKARRTKSTAVAIGRVQGATLAMPKYVRICDPASPYLSTRLQASFPKRYPSGKRWKTGPRIEASSAKPCGHTPGDPVFQGHVCHVTHVQAKQVAVCVPRWSRELCQHLHGGLLFRVAHQRQLNKTLDRAVTQVLPNLFVVDFHLFPAWMRRNVDAK